MLIDADKLIEVFEKEKNDAITAVHKARKAGVENLASFYDGIAFASDAALAEIVRLRVTPEVSASGEPDYGKMLQLGKAIYNAQAKLSAEGYAVWSQMDLTFRSEDGVYCKEFLPLDTMYNTALPVDLLIDVRVKDAVRKINDEKAKKEGS